MAQRLSGRQAEDRKYAEWQMQAFMRALAAGNTDEAEAAYNEITGTLCAMQERATEEEQA